jgi:hypothetical protein
MILACVVVLVGVFFVATGRGGELSDEPPDYAPLDLGPVSATDVALLRPPTALWGYNVPVTDEALERIARAVRERDVTIAYLQQQLAYVAGMTAAAGEVPRAHGPRHGRSAGIADPAGQERPAGAAPGEYRGEDDPAGPAAALPPEEQDT